MGLVLPANAGGGGYLTEKEAGNVPSLLPGSQTHFNIQAGLLEPYAAKEMLSKINEINRGVK